MPIEHMLIETGRFRALGSDGDMYVVVEHTHFLRLTRYDDDPAPVFVDGKKEFETWPLSEPVTEIDGQLDIVARDVLLKRL